jgi:hypothetical protein
MVFSRLITPDGVIVDLRISVSTPRTSRLLAAGMRPPDPVVISALLDTGAHCTLVDASVMVDLKLQPTNKIVVCCLDTLETQEERRAYDVDVHLIDGNQQSPRYTMQVAEHNFGQLPYKALIGRNLLGSISFVYDGPNERVAITA